MESLLTLKIPDGPGLGPCLFTYFEKMPGMIGHESGSIVGVFRFLTTQGIQNNVDPDRVLSRTGDMGLGPSWTITKKKKNPPIMSQLQKIEKMLKLTRILLFFFTKKNVVG